MDFKNRTSAWIIEKARLAESTGQTVAATMFLAPKAQRTESASYRCNPFPVQYRAEISSAQRTESASYRCNHLWLEQDAEIQTVG